MQTALSCTTYKGTTKAFDWAPVMLQGGSCYSLVHAMSELAGLKTPTNALASPCCSSLMASETCMHSLKSLLHTFTLPKHATPHQQNLHLGYRHTTR